MKIAKFVTIKRISKICMTSTIIRTPKIILTALLVAGMHVLSAQTMVTISDGQFICRLSLQQLPDIHYKQTVQKPGAEKGKNQPMEIGIRTGTVTSITILSVKDTNHKQVIIPGKNETVWPWTNSNKEERFIMQDMNFDGYNDIRLLNSTDKFTYYCWIYQPATGQFVADTTLSRFVNPQFDQDQKLVYRNVDLPNDKKTQLYQYINGKFTMIEEDEVSDDNNGKTSTVTVKRLTGGKLQEVSKTQIPKN